MAVYHLTTKVVQRSKGHSAVAAAAYRARIALTSEVTGETWNYSRKNDDVLFSGVFTPKGAPEWMRDPSKLWNSLEKAERQWNGQLARDFTIALPHELTAKQSQYAVEDWVKENITRRGWVAHVAIHKPGKEGDQRNTHAHILVSMRAVEGDGFSTQKYRADNRKSDLETWRESWAKIGNRFLVRFGHEPTLDHRNYVDQGKDLTPTFHMGKTNMEMERQGIPTERGDALRAIHRENRAREIAAKLAAEEIANANTKASDRANDDHPAISKQKFTGNDATAEVAQAQSAIERMKAEERAEQIEALRALGRNRWAAMGDQLREMISTVRRLATTMGATLGNIIKGGGFTRDQDENVGQNAQSDSSVSSASSGADGAAAGRKDFTQNRQAATPGDATQKQQEAPKPAAPVTPTPAQQTAAPATSTSVPRVATEDPLKVLERLAAERRAKKERQDAEKAELARKRLRDGLPVNKPSRKRDFDF